MLMTTNDNIYLATKNLANNDPIMGELIHKYGPCELTPHDRYYEELVSSIVSQQLSVAAARTIWNRLLELFGGHIPDPGEIITTENEKLRSVGLSQQKISYIKDLAQHIVDGSLPLGKLDLETNDEIIKQLTAVRGIGIWSAHMFMIFSLCRLNVLAWGDLGVRKSAMMLYGLKSLPNQKELEAIAQNNDWAPYESIACWYLWKNRDNKP